MVRCAWVAVLAALPACAPMPVEQPGGERGGYAGTVQKVLRVVRQGADLPGIRLLGRAGSVLAPALRQNTETQQYVVRTPGGNIMAQSDHEFAVGDCVAVIPRSEASGPAFRYGDAEVVRSESCTEKDTPSRSAARTL
jgi:hypothetical protein